MRLILIYFALTIFSINTYATSVREWWALCGGNSEKSTCLSDNEISKFKSLCANKNYKKDCQMVVNFVVAKTRMAEGKSFLMSGYANEITYFSEKKVYLNSADLIWNQGKDENAYSFAYGIIPSCGAVGNKKLIFSKKLRSEVKDMQNEIIKIHKSLSSIPCPDIKNGFVLITIGKVVDSSKDFEIFTIDEKKNFKVIHSSLGPGPFISMSN